MLKKMAVIGLTAGALFLAAPTAANAASFEIPAPAPSPHLYAETPRVSVGDPIIDTCEASTVSFGAGYFLPGERVDISVSGVNAAAARISGDVAAGDGSLVVSPAASCSRPAPRADAASESGRCARRPDRPGGDGPSPSVRRRSVPKSMGSWSVGLRGPIGVPAIRTSGRASASAGAACPG